MPEQKRCRACDHPRERGHACVRTTWSAMKAQAKLGCITCAILSEGVNKVLYDSEKSEPSDTSDDWHLRLDFNMHRPERSLEIMVLGTDTVLSFFCSEVTPWMSRTIPDLPVAYEVPPRTSSPESLSWVLKRIDECEKSHLSCSGLSVGSTLPKRVMDVEATPIRLYESQGETGVPYLCLSHVWGDRPFIRTTRDNFSAHKECLDFDKLPPTFQDAITYTQQLGVRYLWIDSLCIIQDDEDDWLVEAEKMAKTFQESFLVLSAAKSRNAYGGLFAEFPSRHCRTYTVEVESAITATGAPEKIHVRRSLTHLNNRMLIHSLNSSPENQALPTLTRGWIFQERFLAARVLHFGPEELYWECLHESTCQCTSSSRPPEDLTAPTSSQPQAVGDAAPAVAPEIQPQRQLPRWYILQKARFDRPKFYYSPGFSGFVFNDSEELATCWHHLVEEYTKLELTFEKDIFPAVSGLAVVIGRKMNIFNALFEQQQGSHRYGHGDSHSGGSSGSVSRSAKPSGKMQYLAGLWGQSLHRDLLWRVGDRNSNSLERSRRPSEWRAPSWSWASVKGPVEFLDQTEGMEVCYELAEEVQCASSGYYAGGMVDLPGKNLLVARGRVLPSLVTVTVKGFKLESEVVKDREPKAWEIIEVEIFKGHLKNVWVDDAVEWLGDEARTVVCLLVGIKKTKALYFLVLRRVQEGSRSFDGTGDIYQRVGVAEVFGGPPGPESWVDRLLSLGADDTVKIR